MTRSRILHEYVKAVLKEDDAGMGYDYSGMGDSPWGVDWGGPGLVQSFVQPFTDVFSTARAAVSDVSTRARALGKVAFEAIVTSVIPFLGHDYEAIFQKEKEDLDKIASKYSDVFARTDKALASDEIKLAAFLLDPALTIAATTLHTAPQIALGVYETLAGTDPYLMSRLDKVKVFLKQKMSTPRKVAGGTTQRSQSNADVWSESRLIEAKQDPVVAALSDPKFLEALRKSPKAQAMHRDAQVAINSAVAALTNRYKQVQSARTMDDLTRLFPKIDQSKLQQLAKLPPEEKGNIEQLIAQQVKAAAAKMYSEALKKKLEEMNSMRLPSNHPLVVGYKKVLSMLGS